MSSVHEIPGTLFPKAECVRRFLYCEFMFMHPEWLCMLSRPLETISFFFQMQAVSTEWHYLANFIFKNTALLEERDQFPDWKPQALLNPDNQFRFCRQGETIRPTEVARLPVYVYHQALS